MAILFRGIPCRCDKANYCLFVVPGVKFNQSSYTVSESERWLQVCAIVDKELEVEVSATIASQDNTADSKCKD